MYCPTKTGVSEQTVCVDHLSSIKYAFHLIDNPRPIRVHVLIVDLSEDKVEPIVVIAEDSPAENCDAVRVDPRKLAEHPLLQAFVTNPWTPWGPAYPLDVKISGLAATGGVVYSPHHGVSVWTNKQGLVFIGNPEVAEIQEGAGGFQQILKAAEVVVQQGGDLHPRTAIGVNEDGDRLYLVVVDGYRFFFEFPFPFPWRLMHFWKDMEIWPLQRVLSDEGQKEFGRTFDYLAGEKIKVVTDPHPRLLSL